MSEAKEQFCAHCGSPLGREEQDRVREIALAAAVAERLSGWMKLLGVFVAVPFALLIAALTVAGVSKWSDFTHKMDAVSSAAEKQVNAMQQRVDKINDQIVPVEKRIAELESSIVLTFGSEGDAVKRLQARLQQLDYFREPVTGKFGLSTEEAVRRFQKDHHLREDGAAGKELFLLLWPPTQK